MSDIDQIEFDEYITPDNITYRFDNRHDKFLLAFSGMGMPDIRYITQPQLHMDRVIDYRLEPRTIQYTHRVTGCSRKDYWNNRSALLNILRPNRQLPIKGGVFGYQLGKLIKYLPNNTVRALDVYLQQGPVFQARSQTQWDEASFQEVLRFVAPDPTAYDPVLVSDVFDVVVTNGGWEYNFPSTGSELVFDSDINSIYVTTDPTSYFGSAVVNETRLITYNGTWLTYPTVILTGPMDQPSIVNQTTGEELTFLYDIKVGDIVTVTLQPGNKTVTDNFGNNLIGVLSTDSDLATFHIAADPFATDGVNTFQVTFTNGSLGVSNIEMQYYTRYIGI